MDSGKVIRQINIDLGLLCESKDIVEMIVTADAIQQAEMIREFAKVYCNDNTGDFCMQLHFISDFIKRNYDNGMQNVIKKMVKTLYEYLGK